MSGRRRGLRGVLAAGTVIGVLAGLLVVGAGASAAPAVEGRRSITGDIDGAKFRVEVPERWNGTLVLYSHGYLPTGFPDFGIGLTNRSPGISEAEPWLLDHGYALAASDFKGRTGYQVKQGLQDQIALLDWFEANVGQPRRTVATGQSLGAAIATLLTERYPHRFDGLATMCGAYDSQGTFNAGLDLAFAIRTLLAEDKNIELVRITDPARATTALQVAIQKALQSEQGRARLALIAAFNNVTGWYTSHDPRPVDPAERIRQQALWLENAYMVGLGPTARFDLEPRAGGNPSWNVGINYAHQLARSSQRPEVEQAYRDAKLDLRADLAQLADAPRIAPDPRAVAFMYRHGIVRGTTPVPVVTMHTIGDGGAVPDQEGWYASQVRRSGDPGKLRQIYVNRGGHCSFSDADEIVLLRTLFQRIETRQWPDTSPRRFNTDVGAFEDKFQQVFDFGTFSDKQMPPAFTRFTPPTFLRPSL